MCVATNSVSRTMVASNAPMSMLLLLKIMEKQALVQPKIDIPLALCMLFCSVVVLLLFCCCSVVVLLLLFALPVLTDCCISRGKSSVLEVSSWVIVGNYAEPRVCTAIALLLSQCALC
jgi:hypothetical protein